MQTGFSEYEKKSLAHVGGGAQKLKKSLVKNNNLCQNSRIGSKSEKELKISAFGCYGKKPSTKPRTLRQVLKVFSCRILPSFSFKLYFLIFISRWSVFYRFKSTPYFVKTYALGTHDKMAFCKCPPHKIKGKKFEYFFSFFGFFGIMCKFGTRYLGSSL